MNEEKELERNEATQADMVETHESVEPASQESTTSAAQQEQPRRRQRQQQSAPAFGDELVELKRQLEQALDELKRSKLQAEVVKHAAELNIAPDLAEALVANAATVEQAKELLSAYVQKHPYLARQQPPQLSVTNPQRPQPLSLDSIRHMTPDEINENWDVVRKILAGSSGRS